MIAIKYSDMEFAFDYVSAGMEGEHSAYLSLDTGKFHYTSELGDDDEDLPDDLETSDRYLAIPYKNELDLGRRLVMRFVAAELPDNLDQVDDIFRRRGAYARYKALLESKDALQRWYDYEQQANKQAILEWCRENEIELIDA